MRSARGGMVILYFPGLLDSPSGVAMVFGSVVKAVIVLLRCIRLRDFFAGKCVIAFDGCRFRFVRKQELYVLVCDGVDVVFCLYMNLLMICNRVFGWKYT